MIEPQHTTHVAIIAYTIWLLGWSIVGLVVYAVDKHAAKAGKDARGSSKKRRVSERSLHAIALVGGFPGAWLGRRWLRHKTRKPVFGVVLAVAATLHIMLIAGLLLVLNR